MEYKPYPSDLTDVQWAVLKPWIPPPPPGVDTNLPPVSENRPVTNRERLAEHTTNKACSGCHNLIDPI